VLSVGWFENIEDLADENKQLLESMANIVALSNIRHIQNLELIKSIEEKNKATQNKSFFIASLSNKVRTSLNAIIGLVDLMRDKNSSEEYADSIANACNGLSQILGNALDYSKIEADTFQLSKEHVKIAECVELTLSSFAKKAHEKGIAFETDFNGIPDLILDKQRFARTISNLAENAVANTQEGWVRLSAKFEKTSDSQGILSIQADDTGRGISDDNLEKIFEPFGGSNPSENIENAGLGLPLIKIFVEKYGGTIDISRRETGGTSVKIVIPNIALALEETEMPKPVNSEKKVSSLLLVDDVDMNLRVMTALCKKVGVEKIITATSAKKALEILAENTFDAVITDMWMPEINGDKLAEKIREMPSAKDTAIIGLTADNDASDKFDPKYFDAMLIKPINAPTLQKIFQNVSASGSQMFRADTDS
jgi:signal transduction histidine kinase/CheY-like chemotaxis protein